MLTDLAEGGSGREAYPGAKPHSSGVVKPPSFVTTAWNSKNRTFAGLKEPEKWPKDSRLVTICYFNLHTFVQYAISPQFEWKLVCCWISMKCTFTENFSTIGAKLSNWRSFQVLDMSTSKVCWKVSNGANESSVFPRFLAAKHKQTFFSKSFCWSSHLINHRAKRGGSLFQGSLGKEKGLRSDSLLRGRSPL